MSRDRGEVPGAPLLAAADEQDPVERSVLLEAATRLLHPAVVVVSVYLLLAGHYRPGGGFAGGLVAALGLTLRYLAGGARELGAASRFEPGTVLGAGLAVVAGYALGGALLAGSPLASAPLAADLPVLGHLETTTTLVLDTGVYLLVIGLALDVLRTLGVAGGDDGRP